MIKGLIEKFKERKLEIIYPGIAKIN